MLPNPILAYHIDLCKFRLNELRLKNMIKTHKSLSLPKLLSISYQ